MNDWKKLIVLDGEGPVYDQIKQAILKNIRSGTWPTGHRIPAESDIADHFNTARMTVNRALRELTEMKLIVRHRRAGSFVAPPPSPSALLEIVDMSTIIPERGQTYSYECLTNETVEATAETAQIMNVPVGDLLRHIVCLHKADEMTIEHEDRLINLTLLPQAEQQDFYSKSPGSWLLETSLWTEAEHTISAINADNKMAGILQIEIGDACLVLERRTFQSDTVVTFARLTHPGDRHRMSDRFRPDKA